MLTAFVLFVLADTARQRAVKMPLQQFADWKIELTSTGGITGRGAGSLVVRYDGSIVVNGNNRCSYQLTAGDLQALSDAIRNAQPDSWRECYSFANANTHCCDLIQWTVTLTARDGRDNYRTSFIETTLPQNLKAIVDLLLAPSGLLSRYGPLCTSTP